MRAGIPKPRVCIIPEQTPNAFATGRNPEHGVVAVTEGIMHLLTPEELKGVIAHEVGHIANRDILVQSVAGVMASVIVMLGNILQFTAIFGGGNNDEEGAEIPLQRWPWRFWLPLPHRSSSSPFHARANSWRMKPEPGIPATPCILPAPCRNWGPTAAEYPCKAAIRPQRTCSLSTRSAACGMAELFSTHPPMEERIRRLQQMAGR